MKQLLAKITVLEHMVNVLRGLRLSPDLDVSSEALRREKQMTDELMKMREERDSRQPDLIPHSHAQAA